MRQIQGNTNIDAGANLGYQDAGARDFGWGTTIQYTRQEILKAISAGQVVQWMFDGTKGRAIAGYCVVATGNSISFVGLTADYSGDTPDLIVRGNIGLGCLSATYAGVTLPDSDQDTVSNAFGYDAD